MVWVGEDRAVAVIKSRFKYKTCVVYRRKSAGGRCAELFCYKAHAFLQARTESEGDDGNLKLIIMTHIQIVFVK